MREHRPVIALDFPSFEAVKEFLALFPAEERLYLKVGMELYYAVHRFYFFHITRSYNAYFLPH